MRSIRRSILGTVLIGGALALTAATGATYFGTKRLITGQFDALLRARMSTLASHFEQEGARVEFDESGEHIPEYQAPQDGDFALTEYFQVWVKDGWARSDSLAGGDLPKEFGSEAQPRVFDLTLPDGRAGRALGAQVEIHHYSPKDGVDPGPERIVIVVARARGELDRALFALVAGSVLAAVLLGGASWFLVTRAVDRGLAPVRELAAHVERIEDPTRAGAFENAGSPAELRPIGDGLNRLVVRLGRMLQRERRTSANIAHELRTPVSELLLMAEAALSSQEAGQPRETLAQVRDVSLDMRRMIGTLLELARLESGRMPLDLEPLELAELVDHCVEPHLETARSRGLALERQGSGGKVVADRGALHILLSNLIGNAVEYAPQGSRIEVGAKNGGATCELWIANQAPDLAREDLDKLSEPFWRGSASREDRSHAGLGLALAARLAEILRAELSFALDRGILRATLRLRAAG